MFIMKNTIDILCQVLQFTVKCIFGAGLRNVDYRL